MATKGSPIERLLPELQILLLQQAGTPDELHALIRSSPRLLQVFLLNKQKILSAVARRQFHPAVLPDALIFAKISQCAQPLSSNAAKRFYKIDQNELREWTDTITSIAEVVTLCDLARNVKFFVEDYASNTLGIMKAIGEPRDFCRIPSDWPEEKLMRSNLSSTDIGRLERAFVRFEVCRHFLARCTSKERIRRHETGLKRSSEAEEQATFYLQQFPDFQITEINCIRDYLSRRLRCICYKLEDIACDTLTYEDFDFHDPLEDHDAEQSDIYIFTEDGLEYQNVHFEYLMSLGLPYIRRLFESDWGEKWFLFTQYHSHRIFLTNRSQLLSIAIEKLGKNPVRGDIPLLARTDPPYEYPPDTIIELGVPDAWQWAHPRAPPRWLSERRVKGLRDWGFVFWDLERLQKSGILQQNVHDVRKIKFEEVTIDRVSVERLLCGHGDLEYEDSFYSDPWDNKPNDGSSHLVSDLLSLREERHLYLPEFNPSTLWGLLDFEDAAPSSSPCSLNVEKVNPGPSTSSGLPEANSRSTTS